MLGVNLMGVVHGVRVFTPMMLEAAAKDPALRRATSSTPPSWPACSTPPNMGVYNVSKHAVVALSETLYQDLRLVTDQVGAACCARTSCPPASPAASATGPASCAADKPTTSQLIGQAMSDKAVGSGKVTRRRRRAEGVRRDRRADRFYIYSHPKALGSVQTRLEDIMQARNPTDPFAGKPEIGAELRAALRA